MHAYIAAAAAAVLLLLAGLYIVVRSIPAPAVGGSAAWGGGTVSQFNPSAYVQTADNPERNSIFMQVQSGPPFHYTPPAVVSSVTAKMGTDFDFDAFIKMISPKGQSYGEVSESGSITYSFIPAGLVSTTTPIKKRTAEQQMLFEYGNAVGSYVQSFEEAHPAQPELMKNFLEDRQNPAKVASVRALGEAYIALGKNLAGVDSIPSAVAPQHAALAKSYQDLGQHFMPIASAGNDSNLLAALQSYNGAADTYARAFVALASLLGAYGVAFSPDDPGSVFTFTVASGF